MTIFLILAPYAAYTLLLMVTSAAVSVFAASAICLATIAIDLARGRSVKILALGSAMLFAGIGDARQQMFVALAAYATYVVNATQFVLKLKAARRDERIAAQLAGASMSGGRA